MITEIPKYSFRPSHLFFFPQLGKLVLCFFLVSLGVLFLFLFYFYWSIVDLQRVLVSDARQSDSLRHVLVFLESFLIKVITDYWVEFSVLYPRSLSVICLIYRGIHVFIPSS